MSNVTERQRKAFFVYVNKVGENRARNLMRTVTRGITSLRDPRMTVGIMTQVLDVFDYYFSRENNA